MHSSLYDLPIGKNKVLPYSNFHTYQWSRCWRLSFIKGNHWKLSHQIMLTLFLPVSTAQQREHSNNQCCLDINMTPNHRGLEMAEWWLHAMFGVLQFTKCFRRSLPLFLLSETEYHHVALDGLKLRFIWVKASYHIWLQMLSFDLHYSTGIFFILLFVCLQDRVSL